MNKTSQNNDYDKYFAYLQSFTWAIKRNEALVRDGFHCSICGNPNNLEVHHLRYPETLGTEPVSDLMTLCRECHRKLEEYKKGHKPGKAIKWVPPIIPTKKIFMRCEGENEIMHIKSMLEIDYCDGGFCGEKYELRFYDSKSKRIYRFRYKFDMDFLEHILKTYKDKEVKFEKDKKGE